MLTHRCRACGGTDGSMKVYFHTLPFVVWQKNRPLVTLRIFLAEQEVQDRSYKLHADYGYDNPESTAASFVGIVGKYVSKCPGQQYELYYDKRDEKW